MDNKTIYKKTIGFSLRRLFWDFLSFLIVFATMAAGFFVAQGVSNQGMVGVLIGLVVGLIIISIILRYVSYSYKAGQIAMMTRGIVNGKLPKDVVGEGKKIVKSRFATVAAYFAATSVIRAIFNEVGRGITSVGRAIGGDTGQSIGSTVSSVIQTIVKYLCDCCLGWVFYRKDQKPGRATLEGAVLFFKHGKTFAKNMGRVFGMSIISFLVIGGVFTGIFYLIFMNYPDAFAQLSEKIATGSNSLPEFLHDPANLTIVCSLIPGVVLWGILHSAFVRPFVLVGVLRNYINSGIKDMPSEKDFAELDKKSKKFQKLHSEV